MSKKPNSADFAEILASLPPWLLGARVQAARMRKFANASIAGAAIEKAGGPRPRTYHSHESGDLNRRPSLQTLELYADIFGVALEFFLSGVSEDENLKADAERFSRLNRLQKGIEINEGESTGSRVLINHNTEAFELSASHSTIERHIVVLTAKDIAKLATGRGDLTTMSGRTLPVPDFIDVSRRCFWYRIPAHDASMVSKGEISLNPGAACLIDLDKPIVRGKPVLVHLKAYDEPLVRIFRASEPFENGGPFWLEALNPAFPPIEIDDRSDCLLIGRIYSLLSLL